MKKTFFLLLLIILCSALPFQQASGQGNSPITLLGRNQQPETAIVDGNYIQLQYQLQQAASADTKVDFTSPGLAASLASCSIKSGSASCKTERFAALGWYWNDDGSAAPQREIQAQLNGEAVAGSLVVSVSPRPVVMVHGFVADFHTWDKYLGSQGYLAELGIRGFALGDGQLPGKMNTGDLNNPTLRTNTIAQNAAILGQYIQEVQKATGAEQVDLLVHSMGGLISRYYIDRLMKDDTVAQLIMLGTPTAGSTCAYLPSSLGLLLPASLEIQPSYMMGVFNQQIVRRRGIPFHALAGTKMLNAVQSPCTAVPSDMWVTRTSVSAITMPVDEVPLTHGDLHVDRSVFEGYVTSLLKTPSDRFETPADPADSPKAPVSNQFSQVFTGHINPGETRDITIPIDANVTVANFAMYDSTRSLTITVVGASGKQIELDAEKNGVLLVTDPSIMLYLGYGFEQPKPGKWVVTMKTTDKTPAAGADFALTAQFNGGAVLSTTQDKTIPNQGERVNIQAALTLSGQPVNLLTASAILRKPDGSTQILNMPISGNQASLAISADQSGIYGIEIQTTAQSADGLAIDRAAFLTIEAQPNNSQITLSRFLFVVAALICCVVFIAVVIGVIAWRRKK